MNHMGTSVSSSVIITVRPVTGIFYILLCVVLTQYCGRGIFTKRPTIFFSPMTHTMQSIADGHIT